MSSISTSLLLLPPLGDPRGLCSRTSWNRPPTMDRFVCAKHGEQAWGSEFLQCHGCSLDRIRCWDGTIETALVLIAHGEVVPEGCDRAFRAAGESPRSGYTCPDVEQWMKIHACDLGRICREGLPRPCRWTLSPEPMESSGSGAPRC